MTGFNEAFIIDTNTKNLLIDTDSKNKEIIKPILTGKDVNKWKINYKDLYLILSKSGDRTDLEYPTIVEFFKKYQDKLKVRWNKGKYWFNLRDCDYYSEFEKPKLIYPEIASQMYAVYDENNYYTNAKCFIITSETTNLQFLGALLSSKTLNFVFKYLGTPLQGKYYNLSKSFVEQLPIYPATDDERIKIVEKAEQMLQLNNKLQNEVNNFQDWIHYTYRIEKVSKKLKKYYELSCEDFLNELKKKKVNVKSRETYQTLKEEFEKSIAIINPLLREIKETDYEIDQMVYNLYDLTEDEIKIIEISLGNVGELDD